MRKRRNVFKGLIATAVIAGMISGTATPFDNGMVQNTIAAVETQQTDITTATADNQTMLQGFEWYTKNDGTFWDEIGKKASHLAKIGVTSVWLPPAYKGDSGTYSVGYDAYDLYDLGEFSQKGTVRTKYGTKDQYLAAINKLHKSGIAVYADAVMNHKMGADTTESAKAYKVSWSNRNQTTSGLMNVTTWTKYNFAGRGNKYSSFKWDATCFDGVDWDQNTKTNVIYRFEGKSWDETSTENGNYDYLMGSDIDLNSEKVRNELKNWGAWYVEFAGLDGYRVDAVKHMEYSFVGDWLTSVRNKTGKDLFAVSEYLDGNVAHLKEYIAATDGTTSLFDYPLFYRFRDASKGYNTDLTKLLYGTLAKEDASHAVTFVNNHDQQAGRSSDTVLKWFMPHAYTFILTRQEGIPCIFYSDYYGSGNGKTAVIKDDLDSLMFARKYCAYGTQTETKSTANGTVLAWARQGDDSHKYSGLASVISSNKENKTIQLNVGKAHAGEKWVDIMGNSTKTVTISSNGTATFTAVAKSACVYVNNSVISKMVTVKKASGLKKVSETDKTVKLKWSKVSGADGYYIYKYDSSKKKWKCIKNVSSNSATITGQNPATGVKYGVKAYKSIGKKKVTGSMSNEVVAYTAPSKPKLTATAGKGFIKLKWKKPCSNIAGYKIYVSSSKNGKYKLLANVSKSSTSKTIKNLTKGKTYYYKIQAYRYNGSKKKDGELLSAATTAYAKVK